MAMSLNAMNLSTCVIAWLVNGAAGALRNKWKIIICFITVA